MQHGFRPTLQTLRLTFKKGTLRVKRSAPMWAVLHECAHEPLQVYWLELPLGFMTGCCPLIVPLLSRPFMQT